MEETFSQPRLSEQSHSGTYKEAEMTNHLHALVDVEEQSELDPRAREEAAVHAWRAEQLARLGLPFARAVEIAADVDWHDVARLVSRGCAPTLAAEIAR